MGLNVTRTPSTYEPVPADNHVGVLIGVTDLGTHTETFPGAEPRKVHKIRLQFELPDITRKDGTTATISAKYNHSLHEKANFRKLLDGWLGNNWTEKYKGQTYQFLLGQPAMVNVAVIPDKQDASRTYSVIQSVTKLPARMQAPEPTRSDFFLDLDDKSLPPELSLRDAELIRLSEEYRAGGFTDEAPRPDGQNGRQADRGPAPASVALPDPDAEDIPF